jgi:dUTPase
MRETTKTIKFKKLNEWAQIPTYAHDGDIGMDIKCISVEYDAVNDVYIYGTGIACETSGHMGVLGMMKSSIYKKGDCYLTNAVGLIDSDQYRGEIKYIYRSRLPIRVRTMLYTLVQWSKKGMWYRLTHNFNKDFEENVEMFKRNAMCYAPYRVGDVCGQLVPITFDQMNVLEVKKLSETERGTGGFGSTEASQQTKTPKKVKKLKPKVKDK